MFKALENNNQNTGGAYIEKGPTVLYIRSEGLVGSIEDIKNIAIKRTSGGTPLFIRDVADIKIGHATRYGAMCYNDKGEVAGAVVMMLKGANSSEVIKNVKERIAQIQKSLPEGVVIEPFLDRTKMVNNAIGTVEKNLMEGALIVVFVLVLFPGQFQGRFTGSIRNTISHVVCCYHDEYVWCKRQPDESGCTGFWFDCGWCRDYCRSSDAPA